MRNRKQVLDEMVVRVVAVLVLLIWHQAAANSLISDTISPSQPLKDGHTLTSGEGNNFVLGFFSPGNSTQLRYVGIWYNKVSTRTVVWVANRDRPINGSNGILSIENDGNLVLSSHNVNSSTTLWSTSISPNQLVDPFNSKAQLLDSGNLILSVIGPQSNKIAWQSFDHLTHILLPGSKLGVDRRTGFSRFLRSWKSNDDPGNGNYTFRVDDPRGGTPEFFVYKEGTVRVWRSGPYVGERWSGLPEMTQNFIFNHTVFESPEEVYFSYTIRNASIIAHFMMEGESGTFKGETWQQTSQQWIQFVQLPQDVCDNYAYCGAFGLCNSNTDKFKCSCLENYEPRSSRDWYLRDASQGCVKARNISMCRNGEGFLKLGNVKVPDTSKAKKNMSKSLEECREECLNNCSCLAFTSATDGGDSHGPTKGCILFYGDLIDTRLFSTLGGQDLYIRVDALELAKSLDLSKSRFNKKRLVILLVCTIPAFTFVTFLAYWFYRKNKRELREEEERSLWLGVAGERNSNSLIFRFSTIVDATQNFESLLGQGGFGPVYKGKLSNGQEIAVKMLSKNSGQGINEFKNEVRLISKLQHRNLVKTLGCCVRGEEKMLVYEFLPNKSLDKYIFDEEKKIVLDWSKRFGIIIGIARGVLYLHQDSRLKIIHRDLKASNILLDVQMNPKISDFGLARIFANDQCEGNTSRIVGTYGYMSPEYAMEGLFSIKSDVFSFGVIILEIISGKRSSRYQNDQLFTNLCGYVWKLWQDRNAMELVDQSIVSTIYGYETDVLRCIQIGLLCVQENPNERPTMLETTFMLSNEAYIPSPKEPAFIFKETQHNNDDSHSSSSGIHSVNAVTETTFYPR